MTASKKMIVSAIFNTLATTVLSTIAHADPLPGEVLKFQQKPLANVVYNGAMYQGHAEPSVAFPFVNSAGVSSYRGVYAADDFADNLSSPIVHVKWWGDYMVNPNNSSIQQFAITFHSDVPSVNGQPSHPGSPLLSQIVNVGALSPGSGTFTETPFNTTLPLRQYNAELNLGKSFPELRDTVYWIQITALTTDTQLKWGWHNRDYTQKDLLASPLVSPGESNIGPAVAPIWHFQDDAVTGATDIVPLPGNGANTMLNGANPTNYIDSVDGPQGIGNYSQDLAFEIYTTPAPEPSTVGVIGMAVCAMLLRRRRASRNG